MNVVQGNIESKNAKIAIVVSRFNSFVVDSLLDGAVDTLKRFGQVGAVIRGGTPHFDFVAGECNKGLAQVALEYDIPVSFGVLTTDTIEQAIERSGTKAGNKGGEAALGLLEMVNVLQALEEQL